MRRLEVLERLAHTAAGQMDVRRELADEPVDTPLKIAVFIADFRGAKCCNNLG